MNLQIHLRAKTSFFIPVCFIAFFILSIKISVTVFSKLAHRFALFISGFLWFKFITAVFIPLKLKSKLSKCVFGSSISGSPSFASLSTFGPPGYPKSELLLLLYQKLLLLHHLWFYLKLQIYNNLLHVQFVCFRPDIIKHKNGGSKSLYVK